MPPPQIDPANEAILNPDSVFLWHKMRALPEGLTLYGGAALALYLGHRDSQDFDFATADGNITPETIAAIPLMQGAHLNGGPGMVDADVTALGRDVRVSFLEAGFTVPMPHYAAVEAHNGVALAHPVDLAASKLNACCQRGTLHDFQDVCAMIRHWPEWVMEAVDYVPNESRDSVLAALCGPPFQTERELGEDDLRLLHEFSQPAPLEPEEAPITAPITAPATASVTGDMHP